MMALLNKAQDLLDRTRQIDFLAPLVLRIYLCPIFYEAGMNKARSFSSTVEWFGNPDWGLGLPFPWLMASLATATELVGEVLLLFGFATRWMTLPLMVTMLVAIFAVHWQNGWLAIATGSGFFATERTEGAITRLESARTILKEHGNYTWLTENGSFVVLNNGIEFATTYLIMLLALFFIGAGRYTSIDYWLERRFREA